MLTGNTTGDSVLAARDNGVNGYVAKPFAKRQIAAKIATVLKLKVQ
jgi:DNA-binding response OmpR family regulator